MILNNPMSTSQINQIIRQELSKTKLQPGDIVEGTLIKKTPRGVFFDLGRFGTGIVYGIELINARDVIKKLNPGDKVPVKVLNLEDETGYVDLSLAEAGEQTSWQKVKELEENGEIINLKITGTNSGGLLGEIFGLKAFLPLSKLAYDHQIKEANRSKIQEELKKFIGQELQVKVISVSPRLNKLVVSEKDAVLENITELLKQYKPGQIVEAIVSGMADFGIFVRLVDNPQIEGVVYMSELDYRIIDDPKDILNLNDVVQAKILEVKENKLILSIKATKPDPWEKIEEKYKVGDQISGLVYKFTPFGALINFDNVQGVVHITDFGGVEEMKSKLEVNKTYQFTIHQIKPEERRIILKLKS